MYSACLLPLNPYISLNLVLISEIQYFSGQPKNISFSPLIYTYRLWYEVHNNKEEVEGKSRKQESGLLCVLWYLSVTAGLTH